jgi:HlyD family secretion protein
MRGKWVLISVSVVLLAIAAGALSRWRSGSSQAAPPQVKAREIPVPAGEVSLSGRIEAQHVTAIGAMVSGSVAEFTADVGQEVYEGEVLARISNQGLETARETANAALEMAQARVEKAGSAIIAARLEATRARADAMRARTEFERAQRTYQRQKMLNAEGATPRLVYEKSEREFETAQKDFQSLDDLARIAENRVEEIIKEQADAKRILDDKMKDLEEAKTNLASAEVHAPADGLVVDRKGEVGKELSPQDQQELFKIAVNPAELQVTLNADSVTLKRVKPGDPALVVMADLGGEGFSGMVKEVQASAVMVSFTSPNPAVKPGMTAQVKLKLQ